MDPFADLEKDQAPFRVNKGRADAFAKKMRRNELESLRAKHGADISDDETDSDVSADDEDAVADTKERDLELVNVLKMIRSKDPQILDPSKKFFSAPVEGLPVAERKYTMRDAHREALIRHGAEASYLDKMEDADFERTAANKWVSEEEAEAARRAFLEEADAVEADAEVDVVQLEKGKRKKKGTKAEHAQVDLDQLWGEIFANASKDKNEAFLKDFIMKEQWRGFDGGDEDEEDDGGDGGEGAEQGDSGGEEEFDETQEKFETDFEQKKFAHETKASLELVSYPRKIESEREVRNARKEARQRKKERKRADAQAEQERERLKELEREEAAVRIDEINKAAGKQLFGSRKEVDFDTLEEYDKKAEHAFNDEYYAEEDDAFDPDEEWDLETALARLKKEKAAKKGKGASQSSPNEDAGEASLSAAAAMPFEDVLTDGTKTRFKYVDVNTGSHGLEDWELLTLDDRTLNAIFPMKFIAPFKSRAESGRIRDLVQENVQRLRRGTLKVSPGSATNKYRPGFEGADEDTLQEIAAHLAGLNDGGASATGGEAEEAPAGKYERRRRKKEHEGGEAVHAEEAAEKQKKRKKSKEGEGDATEAEAPAKKKKKKARVEE